MMMNLRRQESERTSGNVALMAIAAITLLGGLSVAQFSIMRKNLQQSDYYLSRVELRRLAELGLVAGFHDLKFNATGGQLFGALFVGALLTGITFGLYLPWFMCKLQKLFSENTELLEGTKSIGKFDFVGQGGEFFGIWIVGAILTCITFGIYAAWFQVNQFKFFLGNTRISVGGTTLSGEFDGTGGEYFGVLFVGTLLTMITLGIYSFWFITNQIRFQTDHTMFRASAVARAAA